MITTIGDFLSTKQDLLWAGIVAALVSTAISSWFRRKEIRHSAEVEYEYEERKRLRELIGRHHGRLLNAANSMNYRMWNLYANHSREWLDVNGNFPDAGYYFCSTVYRFMNVCSQIRLVEREAFLLDTRIARKKDFAFLNYIAALHWVMTDVALTEGLQYDDFHQTDHFFADHFREYCDACVSNGAFPEIADFSSFQADNSRIAPVLEYFDGLTREEARLRWDRLVAFHLILLAFINTFGYRRQYTSTEKFRQVASQMQNEQVLRNLVTWLPRHDLGTDREAKKIVEAARRETDSS